MRLRKASTPAGSDGAATPLEADRDVIDVDAEEDEEDGWSSSGSGSSSGEDEGAGEEWDAAGGRVVPPAEPVAKFSARGETVLGA